MIDRLWVSLLVGAIVLVLAAPRIASAQVIERVSVATDGTQARQSCREPSISADERYVVFDSYDGALVPGDTNGSMDVFLRDRVAGTTTLVSVASDGGPANGSSQQPSIGADGRYVAFTSFASNLVANDTNGTYDVFVRDRFTNETFRVSTVWSGISPNSNGQSNNPSISTDGRYVAFASFASNLVVGDTNGETDVFVCDLVGHTTTRVSVASDGIQGNHQSGIHDVGISADGRYVVFDSMASNLVPFTKTAEKYVYLHDCLTGETSLVSVASDGTPGNSSSGDYGTHAVTAGGRFVVFQSWASNLVVADTNNCQDVFLRDRLLNTTTRISVSSSGAQGWDDSLSPSFSADGRYIAFTSYAINLVAGDPLIGSDVFICDRLTGQTARVSVSGDGTPGNSECWEAVISADGHYVAFSSNASNLVPGDTNATDDVFIAANPLWQAQTQLSQGFQPTGWHLISLPGQPVDDDPATVFAGLPITDRLWRYDAALRSYVAYWDLNPAEFGVVQRGEGYWLYIDDPSAYVSYQAYAQAGTVSQPFPQAGWQMIGLPQPEVTPLAACSITHLMLDVTATYTDAALSLHWVQEVIYGWDPDTQGYWEVGLSGPLINDDYRMLPWRGYWFKTAIPNLALNVPPP